MLGGVSSIYAVALIETLVEKRKKEKMEIVR